jgi:ABC-type dipeptide/oligopeptide/nickel transport system permease subunit
MKVTQMHIRYGWVHPLVGLDAVGRKIFVVFVVAGYIVYVLAVVVSFIVVFLYCVCA